MQPKSFSVFVSSSFSFIVFIDILECDCWSFTSFFLFSRKKNVCIFQLLLQNCRINIVAGDNCQLYKTLNNYYFLQISCVTCRKVCRERDSLAIREVIRISGISIDFDFQPLVSLIEKVITTFFAYQMGALDSFIQSWNHSSLNCESYHLFSELRQLFGFFYFRISVREFFYSFKLAAAKNAIFMADIFWYHHRPHALSLYHFLFVSFLHAFNVVCYLIKQFFTLWNTKRIFGYVPI